MKKVYAFLALILVFAIAGCGSIGHTLLAETKAAISEGRLSEALAKSKQAIQEGSKDKELLAIEEILECCSNARNELEQGNLAGAEGYLDMIENVDRDAITSSVADAIAAAVETLEDDIYALRAETEEIDALFESVQEALDSGSYFLAETEVEKLLEKNLTEEQKNKAQGFLDHALAGQESESEMASSKITKEQAIEIGRKALQVPDNAKVTAVQYVEYFIVNAEVDYGDFTDECACKVSTYDGRAYDFVG